MGIKIKVATVKYTYLLTKGFQWFTIIYEKTEGLLKIFKCLMTWLSELIP